jgi:hypothetical protein
MVVYGFSLCTLKFAEQDRLTLALAAQNKEYDENITVQFINEADKSCVAEYKFEGKLQYNTEVKVDLPRPFLAEKSTPYSLYIDFHHQHIDRNYPGFFKEVDKDQYGNVNQDNYQIYDEKDGLSYVFPYINKLFFKLI